MDRNKLKAAMIGIFDAAHANRVLLKKLADDTGWEFHNLINVNEPDRGFNLVEDAFTGAPEILALEPSATYQARLADILCRIVDANDNNLALLLQVAGQAGVTLGVGDDHLQATRRESERLRRLVKAALTGDSADNDGAAQARES